MEYKYNVIICGYIYDLSAFYRQGDVAINPVYLGTGIKIKTFEALSYMTRWLLFILIVWLVFIRKITHRRNKRVQCCLYERDE